MCGTDYSNTHTHTQGYNKTTQRGQHSLSKTYWQLIQATPTNTVWSSKGEKTNTILLYYKNTLAFFSFAVAVGLYKLCLHSNTKGTVFSVFPNQNVRLDTSAFTPVSAAAPARAPRAVRWAAADSRSTWRTAVRGEAGPRCRVVVLPWLHGKAAQRNAGTRQTGCGCGRVQPERKIICAVSSSQVTNARAFRNYRTIPLVTDATRGCWTAGVGHGNHKNAETLFMGGGGGVLRHGAGHCASSTSTCCASSRYFDCKRLFIELCVCSFTSSLGSDDVVACRDIKQAVVRLGLL